jgi:hypothetical protein
MLDGVTADVSWGGTRCAEARNRRALGAAELEPYMAHVRAG